MKEWEVIFADQKGEPSSLVLHAEHCPSEEDAARHTLAPVPGDG